MQADTDIPESQGVQAYDRFAYANNNPVKYIDPSGHDAIPYEELIQQVINFFTGKGYEIVGNTADAAAKSIYTNGADLVFKANQTAEVLAVEVKNVVGNVNLGTLGKNAAGDYGSSITRVVNSAGRFLKLNQYPTKSRKSGDHTGL